MTTPVLNYTARDWSRWDGFDLQRYTYVSRTSHGLQNSPLSVTSTTSNSAIYYHMVRQEVMTSFYAPSRQAFLWLQKAPGSVDDYLNNLRLRRDFAPGPIINKMSYTINQEYNAYRLKRTADLRYALKLKMTRLGPLPVNATLLLDDQSTVAFDKETLSFNNLPAIADLRSWFSELLNLHLDFQCTDPTIEIKRDNPADWRGPTWKPYGHWPEYPAGTYNQGQLWWYASDFGFLYAHYLHLLDDVLIRRIRKSARAVLGGLWAIYKLTSDPNPANYQGVESQWMLRISSWVNYSYVIKRADDELTLRGSWGKDSSDQLYEDMTQAGIDFRLQRRVEGYWSRDEAVLQGEIFVEQLYERMRMQGQTEFLSSYDGFHLNPLSDWLLHCPSQKIYDMSSAMWARIQWDIIANFHPGSGSVPAPSSRSYDLFTGTHSLYHRLDQYLYYKHIFPNATKPNTLLRVLTNGETIRATLALGDKLTPKYLPPQYGELVQSFHRNMYSMAQLAGEGKLLYQWLIDCVVQSPTRVNEQRFSLTPGQERYNFITPHYSIGHAGENNYLLSTSALIVGRMSGRKTTATDKSQYLGTSYLRIAGDIGGNGLIRPMRSVITQYQGFMLVTQLFAPTRDTTSAEMVSSEWVSNLILPLGVDSLTLTDGQILPMTIGSTMNIPLTQATFTVQHGEGAIVVRLVSYDHLDEGGITWQVDEASSLNGVGKIVVQHRGRNSTSTIKPFKVVWLLGSGTFSSELELKRLRGLIADANVLQEFQVNGIWDETNQPRSSYPLNSPSAPVGEVGSRRWTSRVSIGALQLLVDRTDAYLPWSNSPVYNQPIKGPLHRPPYYSKTVKRMVNGVEVLQWLPNEDSYRTSNVQPFAPHRLDMTVEPGRWIHAA